MGKGRGHLGAEVMEIDVKMIWRTRNGKIE